MVFVATRGAILGGLFWVKEDRCSGVSFDLHINVARFPESLTSQPFGEEGIELVLFLEPLSPNERISDHEEFERTA